MSEAPRSGQVVAGKYRVRQCLGSGGMGAVYEAENIATGKRVALKWLHEHLVADPAHSERFLREAKMLAKIRHPNVVDLYDVGRDQDSFFLVLEFLEGESLGSRLDREVGPIPETLTLLIDAMRGVAAAHRQGIIHRDLKPDNIFLARESDDGSLTPKLLDFGISKLAFQDSGQLKLTKTGSIFGTPRYMSFEQLMGQDVDARTDVYSFGVILYEALTGEAPYPASNFQQLIVQIGSLKPTPPRKLRPEIPRELDRVILSTLSHDRAQRPESIDALIKALLPFRESSSETRVREARPGPLAQEVPGAGRAWGKPALLAAGLCVSCVGGWLLAAREAPVAPPPPVLAKVVKPVEVPAAIVPDGLEPPDAGIVEQPPVVSAPLVPASTARLAPPLFKPKPAVVSTTDTINTTIVRHEEAQRRRRTPGMSAEEF